MQKKHKWLIGILVLALTACGGPNPQRPSTRLGKGATVEADSAQLALMEYNARMVEAADKELMTLAQTREGEYAVYDTGTWMRIDDPGDLDAEAVSRGDRRTVAMRVYDLKGQLLIDSHREYTIGQMEMPFGIDMNVRHLHPGARVRMLMPWYAAFGMQGNDYVPPYTNVIIDLEIQ